MPSGASIGAKPTTKEQNNKGFVMLYAPLTLEAARQTRYGVWAGNPKGHAYIEGRCAYEQLSGPTYHQCRYKNGKGPGGLYCGIHARKIRS